MRLPCPPPFAVRALRAALLPCILGSLASACRPASSPVNGGALTQPDLLPADPAVHAEVLDNGVTYLSKRIASEQKVVQLSLVVRAGTFAEAESERGFAHFVEHLAFSGTRHFPRQQLRQFIGWQGTSLNAHVHGRTGPDWTYFDLQLPAQDPKALDRGTALLADWATAISFEPAAVLEERAVILAETIHRSDAVQHFGEQLSELLQTGSIAPAQAGAGTEEAWKHASAAQLEAFYRHWYQPQNLALLAIGDFDPEEMRDRVVESLGKLPRPEQPSPASRPERPAMPGERITTLADPDSPLDEFVVASRSIGRRYSTRADHRERVLERLMTRMIEQRLEALPYRAGSHVIVPHADLAYAGSAALLTVSAVPQMGTMTLAGRELLVELERLERHQFLSEELSPARNWVQRQLAAEQQVRSSTRAAQTQALLEHFVYGTALVSPADVALLDRELLPSITLEELNQHLVQWLRAERHLILLAGDAQTLPSEGEVAALAATARAATVEPYAVEPVPDALMAELPRVTVSRELPVGEGVWLWTLANGARVVFKATHYEPGRVQLLAFSPGGRAQSPRSYPGTLQLALEMADFMGVGRYSAYQVKAAFSNAGVTLTSWISNHEQGLNAGADSAGLGLLLQAIHERLSSPRRSATEFSAFREIEKTVLTVDARPSAFFAAEMERQVWGADPRYVAPEPAALEHLDLESSLALYRERFAPPGDLTFVIVGDAHAREVQELVERYLATLPAVERKTATTEPEPQLRSGITRIRVQRGTADNAHVAVWFHGGGPLPKQARQELEALQYYLHLRLVEVLRGTLGGVYGVDVWHELEEPLQQNYRIGFSFDCVPERAEALKSAALEAIEELKRGGAAPALVQELKEQRARHARAGLTQNQFWLDELANAYRQGTDPVQIPRVWQTQAGIGSQELKSSAQRYLRSDQYVDAMLLPEAPAGNVAVSGHR
jgi:zinc protease